MSDFGILRCQVLPGDGLVCRWPGHLALFVGGPDALDEALKNVESDGLNSLIVAARSIDWVEAGGGYALLSQASASTVKIEGTGSCDAFIDGRRISVGEITGLQLPAGSSIEGIVDRRKRELHPAHRVLNLTSGIVPGAGFGLVEARNIAVDRAQLELDDLLDGSAFRAAEKPDEPTGIVPIASAPKSFELFDIGEPPVEAPPPLPLQGASPIEDSRIQPEEVGNLGVQVKGILCSRKHFNHPEAAYCMICGISMAQLTNQLVDGERPTLGYLVQDDGTSFHLRQGYTIGRSPDSSTEGGSIVLHDVGVSRQHARIVLREWNVVLIDDGSTNGTRYRMRNDDNWTNLEPNGSITLLPGMSFSLGGHRSFAFEAVHKLAE